MSIADPNVPVCLGVCVLHAAVACASVGREHQVSPDVDVKLCVSTCGFRKSPGDTDSAIPCSQTPLWRPWVFTSTPQSTPGHLAPVSPSVTHTLGGGGGDPLHQDGFRRVFLPTEEELLLRGVGLQVGWGLPGGVGVVGGVMMVMVRAPGGESVCSLSFGPTG